MSPRRAGGDAGTELDREVERYRQAATATLELLEWVVGYLRRINKPQIAAAIDQNRKKIESSLR
jgi:hypothetical protein